MYTSYTRFKFEPFCFPAWFVLILPIGRCLDVLMALFQLPLNYHRLLTFRGRFLDRQTSCDTTLAKLMAVPMLSFKRDEVEHGRKAGMN